MLNRIPFLYRLPIIYIVLGVLWILFSDKLIAHIAFSPLQLQIMSMLKGCLYFLITGVLLFFLIRNEIRKQNSIYKELLDNKKKAVESDNLKTAFLANLSHYIRTPMNSILGFIELLDDKDTTPENYQLFLGYINENSKNLLQTMNNIVDISKIQQGQAKVEPQDFRMNSLVRGLVSASEFDLDVKRKPITIKTSFGWPDGKDSLFSDSEKISHILACLLDNAIRFTASGEIEIGYSDSEKCITFFVKDSGVGISEEKQKMLFTKFMSNSSYTIVSGEGPGLGLYMASGLAQLIGAKLWLESTGPEGSLFCLSISKLNV